MPVKEISRSEGLQLIADGCMYQLPEVDCIINEKQVHSGGSLYLTQDYAVFISSETEDYSISIEYQLIGVHAVCHETQMFNRPCIYCQISEPSEEGCDYQGEMCDDISFDAAENDDEIEENESVETGIFEVLFSPVNSGEIDSLFDAISRLQLMHPDEAKEDDDDGSFMTANGIMNVEDHLANLFEQADLEYQENKEQE